jgi:hypothetical protein
MKKIAVMTFVTLSLLLFALTSYAPARGPTPAPDFVITCAQSTLSAPRGTTVNFQLSLTPINGFEGTASFACAASMPGVACRAPAGTVRLGPNLAVPFEVTAQTGADVPLGTHPIVVTVTGTYGAGSLAKSPPPTRPPLEPCLNGCNVVHSKMLYVTTVSETP